MAPQVWSGFLVWPFDLACLVSFLVLISLLCFDVTLAILSHFMDGRRKDIQLLWEKKKEHGSLKINLV